MSTPATNASVMPGALQVGDVLDGKYRVERVIGRGGMGVVVEAWHGILEQRVAIKVLSREAHLSADGRARFLGEARLSAKLASPHVARVFDVGTLEDGTMYLVIEYLAGKDLGRYLAERGALPVSEAVDYVMQACHAIAEAHSFGIVHRDLKPENLFLATQRDGSTIIKVLDFGIAKLLDTDRDVTADGNFVGTPQYMAPEQIRSPRDVDGRADVWAAGVVLYQLLTDDVPFSGEVLAVLGQILHQAPVPVHQRRPDLPAELAGVIMRCLEKDRLARFANVAELATALVQFTDEPTVNIASIRRLVSPGAAEAVTARLPSDPSVASAPARDVESARTLGDAQTVARFDTAGLGVVAPIRAPGAAHPPPVPAPLRQISSEPVPKGLIAAIAITAVAALVMTLGAVGWRAHARSTTARVEPAPRLVEPPAAAVEPPPRAAAAPSATHAEPAVAPAASPLPSASASPKARPPSPRPSSKGIDLDERY